MEVRQPASWQRCSSSSSWVVVVLGLPLVALLQTSSSSNTGQLTCVRWVKRLVGRQVGRQEAWCLTCGVSSHLLLICSSSSIWVCQGRRHLHQAQYTCSRRRSLLEGPHHRMAPSLCYPLVLLCRRQAHWAFLRMLCS